MIDNLTQFSHTFCKSRKCTQVSLLSFDTPQGTLIAATDDEYLYALHFEQSSTLIKVFTQLHQHPTLQLCITDKPSKLAPHINYEINQYFNKKSTTFTIPYKLFGTLFQQSVWNALTTISYGKTTSYKEIAATIQRPKSARAVGNANNINPISIIVPCHRVIHTTGSLAGYAGGIQIKQELLNLEKNNHGTTT